MMDLTGKWRKYTILLLNFLVSWSFCFLLCCRESGILTGLTVNHSKLGTLIDCYVSYFIILISSGV